MKKGLLLVAIALVLLFIIGAGKFSSFISWPGRINTPDTKNDQDATQKEEAKKKLTDFISANGGGKVEVTDMTEESGLYKVAFKVDGKAYTAYLTKDGKTFFPQSVSTEPKKETASVNDAPEEITKSDKPTVDLYVMSFCPFGNKAEDTLKPVYNLLKNKVSFNFHYIVSTSGAEIQSLHGPKEVAQDEREMCVLKNDGADKWMDFVTYVNTNCGSDGACWEAGAKQLGLNSAAINSCVTSQGLDLMKAEEKASKDANADGSPTMIINGTTTKAVYKYGNSEEYKKVICSAFNEAPSECSQTLSSSTSTAQGGSCGN